MNRHDPNGPRRDFEVRAGRQADERGGFGAPRQDPSLRYEPERDPGIHFRGDDPEHGADEEEDLAGEGPARRRRGEKEVSPYPRHHVAALGAKTRVVRDARGVPHIHAKEERDAYAALGFCMAQDRLAQMDRVRRAATGRVAEVLGERFARRDALVRTAGVGRRAAAAAASLQGFGREVLAAFVGGVNAVCAAKGSAEELGYPVQPWTIADCLAVELYTAWAMSLEIWPAKLSLARILAVAGRERARWITPVRLDLENTDEERAALWRRIDPRLCDLGPHAVGGGSVFAGASEGQRDPFLACEVRLPSSLPSAFYLAHLEAPGLSVVGAALVGLPAMVIGRNGGCAWGISRLALDDVDCVTEELDGIGNFRTEAGWRKLSSRREIIRVRDGRDLRLDVLETRNGPLLSHLLEQLEGPRSDGIRPVSLALRWGVGSLSSGVAGWLSLARCSTVDEAAEAAALLDRGPVALGLVAADSGGRIARFAVGSLPTRSADAWLPVRGWSGEARWRGSSPLSTATREMSDERGAPGWIAATGEAFLGEEGRPYPAHRFAPQALCSPMLAELLQDTPPTPERCAEILARMEPCGLARLLPRLRGALDRAGDPSLGEIAQLLSASPATLVPESPSFALLYVALTEHLLPELFPEARFGALARSLRFASAALHRIVEAEVSPWFATPADRDSALLGALRGAAETLRRRLGPDPHGWNLSATSTLPRDGAVDPALSTGGPDPGLESSVAGAAPRRSSHPTLAAPALRMVVDLGTRGARLILAGGQSGKLDHAHFADQLALLQEGGFVELQLGPLEAGDIIELVPV